MIPLEVLGKQGRTLVGEAAQFGRIGKNLLCVPM